MELAGRVALVTGGARRLGRAFVEALAGRGMHLAIHHGASAAEAGALAQQLRGAGHRVETFGADLRRAEEALALPRRVVEHFGQLDVLVNSAAVMERIAVADTTVEQWDDILDLNLRAPFLLAQQNFQVFGLGFPVGTLVVVFSLFGLRCQHVIVFGAHGGEECL